MRLWLFPDRDHRVVATRVVRDPRGDHHGSTGFDPWLVVDVG